MKKSSSIIILLRIVCKVEYPSILSQNSRFLLVEAGIGGFFSCLQRSSEVDLGCLQFLDEALPQGIFGYHITIHWRENTTDFLILKIFAYCIRTLSEME
jgi:hypothetical protein